MRNSNHLRNLASKIKVAFLHVQYFSFFPDHFEVSDNMSFLEPDMVENWDYALEDDGKITGYIAGDDTWSAKDMGTNPWGLMWLEPGRQSYDKYPQYKHLGK